MEAKVHKREFSGMAEFMVLELNSKYAGQAGSNRLSMAAAKERRKRSRIGVSWAVWLSRSGDGTVIQSRTKDLSTEGFYCITSERLALGERLQCTIMLPKYETGSGEEHLWLRCFAQVVRVETIAPEGGFGVGCRIDDYSVIRFPSHSLASSTN